MCGIAGYMGQGNREILENMVHAIKHRGPDNQGFEIIGNTGLGHARLSILDVSSKGHQPMWNDKKTVAIVFNGEIYNFQELKNKEIYTSGTDTEVILSLYDEYGEKVFEKIHGMFSIAIYDTRNNKLILARDRLGKKPLYWGIHNNTFLFGSELKALFAHPDFKKEIDIHSLNKYFFYEYIPTPYSIFKNTYKLEPGTYVTWDGTKAQKTTFWKPDFTTKEINFDDSLKILDQKLEKAVRDRLVADVPVGIFLSGGLDSSLIAHYASKYKKIKTFSIGFDESSFDESKYAAQVSRHLNTEHYEKVLSSKDSLDIIPKIAELLDEPVADASIVPTYLLSKFAHENVIVILGGDGGDELFYGYDTFTAHKIAEIYKKMPRLVRSIFEKIVFAMPTSFSNMSLDFKLKKFIEGFYGDEKGRNQRWMSPFSEKERSHLLKKDFFSVVNFPEFINLAHEYQQGYMMDQILVKVDRASMFNSLEVRAPFLDTAVVEFANALPDRFKMKRFEKKYILKKLMEGKLPNNIIYRKKKGFGMPIAEWIRGDLKDLVLTHLSEESLNKIGLFNYEYVKEIIDQHMQGKRDNRKQIWSLLTFALWWKKWVQ